MKVIFSNQEEIFEYGTGIGLGNFDGIHIGHLSLINTLVRQCYHEELKSVLYTFENHPQNVLKAQNSTKLITDFQSRREILDKQDIDYLFVDRFDEVLSRMLPDAFVKEILIKRLNIKFAVVGSDYRFGFRGKGDVSLLYEFGKKFGFRVIVVPVIKFNNCKVSSTMLRGMITDGDFNQVQKLLGRYFSVSGVVLEGRKIGRTIGFPTANLAPKKNHVVPSRGVYITKTRIGDKLYCSITNVGKNPTFGDLETTSIETYIIDFDEVIYGINIEVYFIRKTRDEVKFNSKEELISQMNLDLEIAKNYFSSEYERS